MIYTAIWIGHYASVFPWIVGHYRSISFKYQMDVFRYLSILRLGISIPSFSHVYLRGVDPVARHFNLIECDAGQVWCVGWLYFYNVIDVTSCAGGAKADLKLYLNSFERQRKTRAWFLIVCKWSPYFFRKSLSVMRFSMITLHVILAVLKIKCTKVVGKEEISLGFSSLLKKALL